MVRDLSSEPKPATGGAHTRRHGNSVAGQCARSVTVSARSASEGYPHLRTGLAICNILARYQLALFFKPRQPTATPAPSDTTSRNAVARNRLWSAPSGTWDTWSGDTAT